MFSSSNQPEQTISTITEEIIPARPSIEESSCGNMLVEEMFKKPTFSQLEQFFKFHPQPPTAKVSFDVNRSFNRTTRTGVKLSRHWLTFDDAEKRLHCSLCLAYSNCAGCFTTGLADFTHVYQRIEEHKCSKSHLASVEAFLIRKSSGNIVHLVDNSVLGIRKREIEQRGAVVQTLIRMVMFLGKQGLAFRGKRYEAIHELTDDDVNHGNYLELVKLVAESDDRLKDHMDRVGEPSRKALLKRQREGKTHGNYGRGSLVTFLSHDITTRIIRIIRDFIQESIAGELKSAGMFLL